jgi:hypothetical protein
MMNKTLREFGPNFVLTSHAIYLGYPNMLSEKPLGLVKLNSIDTPSSGNAVIAAVLSRFSEFINQRIMELTAARGHVGLKPSFSQVLVLVAPSVSTIKEIAEIRGVNELLTLGYLEKSFQKDGSRTHLLAFSEQGKRLISDSIDAVENLAHELRRLMGPKKWIAFHSALETIYTTLNLPQLELGPSKDRELLSLALKLRKELGRSRATVLGQLLK